MKKLLRIIIVVTILCLVSGCSLKSSDKKNEIKVGITLYDRSDVFIYELLTEMRRYFEELVGTDTEIYISVRDAKGSQRVQNDQVDELLNEGCDILCVNLVDRADPSSIIDAARNNNTPIVFFNREPVLEDLMQWDKLYYVGTDARQSGQLQGDLAIETITSNPEVDLNGDGVIQYVVLEGEAGHQDAIIRTEASVSTIQSSGIKLEKISYQIANWNRAQAQNRMEQIMSQSPTGIELVLANNDEMALGAIDAYEKSDIEESDYPIVYGIDGTKEGIATVKEGRMAGSVYNDKEGQANIIVNIALALARNENMDRFEFTNDRCIYVKYKKIY